MTETPPLTPNERALHRLLDSMTSSGQIRALAHLGISLVINTKGEQLKLEMSIARNAFKLERAAAFLFVSDAITQMLEISEGAAHPDAVFKQSMVYFAQRLLVEIQKAEEAHKEIARIGGELEKFHLPTPPTKDPSA